MKPYKLATLTRVFGYEYLYEKMKKSIIISDVQGRFFMDVKNPEPVRSTTYIKTVLDDLRGQKCIMHEEKWLGAKMTDLRLKGGIPCWKTGVILPSEAGEVYVLQSLNEVYAVDKEYLDTFNCYDLAVNDQMVIGTSRDGLICLQKAALSIDKDLRQTIELLSKREVL